MEQCKISKLNYLLELVNDLIQEENLDLLRNNVTDTFSITKKPKLYFTQKEIDKIPTSFRKEFRTDGCTVRIFLPSTCLTLTGCVLTFY